MVVAVTTYFLEMTRREDLRPKRSPRGGLSFVEAKIPLPELNRFLYTAVGGDLFWVDRLGWTYEEWSRYLMREALATWILYVEGTPAGYCELENQPGGDVEIRSLGLIPRFVGEGLGGHLLTEGVERAWDRGAERVWLHTCSLDHPKALNNYLARGFREFRRETQEKDLPLSPGPWPNAARGSALGGPFHGRGAS